MMDYNFLEDGIQTLNQIGFLGVNSFLKVGRFSSLEKTNHVGFAPNLASVDS